MPLFEQPWPRTHREVIQRYYEQYDKGIQSGGYEPFIYPWGTFGALVVILYLLIPHANRPWLKKARFLAFGWIVAFAAYCIMYTRARGMASSFGIGLISAWSIVWLSAILVANDAQTEFQRIERTEGLFGGQKSEAKHPSKSDADDDSNQTHENGTSNGSMSSGVKETVHGHQKPNQRHGEFAWQPYPLEPFAERLDWVLDIFCNFKGMGWNWRISSLPPPPKYIQEQLNRNSRHPPRHSYRTHPGQTKVYNNRRDLLVAATKTVITGYLVLDALKTFLNHDPYFWGQMERPPPSFLPAYLANSPVMVKMYRLTISQLMIKYSLQSIFALAPLFFAGLLGPSRIGARAEPWMYPEEWGSYSIVLERGLAGWWSGWWHQTFQFAFKEPSRKLVEITGMNLKSPSTKLLQLIIAFGLSGFLHACGSYTQPGNTRPILGPMCFFLLQAVGIFAEVLLTQALRKTGIQRYVPKWSMSAFAFVYVHFWFYHTAPLLCDDFAKGGIWLYEPVPFSIFRSLGFGVKGDGFWCWGGQWVRPVRNNRWWTSGLAF